MAQLQASTVAGTLTTTGNVGIGTVSTTYSLYAYKDINDGLLATIRNPSTGTAQYVELKIGQSDNSEVRIGSAYNYASAEWNQSWIYAVNRNLALKTTSGYNIRFYTGGTVDANERMRIDTNGNVGIGTASPVNKLQIGSTGASNYAGNDLVVGNGAQVMAFTQFSTVSTWYTNTNFALMPAGTGATGNVGIGITTPQAPLDVNGNIYNRSGAIFTNTIAGYSTNVVSINTNTNFYIPSGNVGIGTASPSRRLTISEGTGANTNSYLSFNNSAERWVVGNEGGWGGNDFIIYDTDYRMVIKAGGAIGIGTTNPGINKLQVNGRIYTVGTVSQANAIFQGGQLEFYKDATPTYAASIGLSGPSSGGTNDIVFETYGGSWSERMRIATGGNVGIGTTTPTAKLHVYGAATDTILEAQSPSGSVLEVNGLLSGSLFNVNNAVGVPILVVSSDDKVVMGTFSAKTLVVTGSSVGVGTASPTTPFSVFGSGGTALGNTDIVALFKRTTANENTYLALDTTTADRDSGIRFGDGGTNRWTLLNYRSSTTDGFSFYNHTANEFAMLINNSSNIGISTTNPIQKLDVNGSVRIVNTLRIDGFDTVGAQRAIGFGGNTLGTNPTIYSNGSYLSVNAASANILYLNGNSTGNVVFNGGGNIGIGTASPTYPLHVYAGTNLLRLTSTTTDARINIGHSANGGFIGYTNLGATGNVFYVTTGAGTIGSGFVMDNNGNVGIGLTNPNVKLHVLGPALTVTNENTYGLWVSETGDDTKAIILGYDQGIDAGIITAVDKAVTWKNLILQPNDQNVGIGITNPAAKLVVTGQGSGTGLIGNAGFSSNYTGISLNGTLSAASYNILSSPTEPTLYINRPSGASIRFRESNGSDQMVITTGGNVGIGLTNPGATFVVGAQSSGQAGSGYESDNSIVSRFGASNSGRRMIGLTIANTAAATVGNDASLSFIVAGNYSATGIISTILQNTGTAYSDMTFSVYNGSGNPERMRINGVAGNVGIGNTNPSRKLDVLEGNVQIVANFQNTSTTSSRIKFTDANTGAENVNIGATGTSLAMWTNNTVRMTILSGGNVGIGSNTPGTKLDVSGSIRGGSFPNSLTNSGEAWLGRAADRTLGTMTFQLGGSSATNTVFEIVDRAWTKVMYAFSGEAPSDSIRVNASGNVGINTGTPTHKLHVNGNLRVDNLGSSPPTSEGPPPESYVGSNSYWLGRPAEWLAINVSGTDYVIPLYSTG